MQHDRAAATTTNRGAWILLAGIMLLGFVLRVYRLEEQSLWWDDYNGLAHLTVDGFLASMFEARRVNPEGAPLYHVVQYAASLIIGQGEYAQRMLNVGFGVIVIPIVFAIGRHTFGVRAGLVAALLFALSPPHIYHAQSLRAYPLAMLLATVGLYSLERMLSQRKGRWLFLNAMANGLLCLTHLFGLFAVLAQAAAAVLLLSRRDKRMLAAWGAVQLVFLLPAAGWAATMAGRTEGDFWHFSFPTVGAIFKDLFGDDLADFAISRAPWPFEVFGFPLDGPWVSPPMAFALMGVFVIVVAWALWRLVSTPRENGAVSAAHDGAMHRSRLVLMLCFWFLPVAFLLVFAALWHPVIYPRYTLYACLGLYMLTGALVQSIQRPRIALAVAALIGALYAYQLALLLPSDTRTQWRQAARHIATDAGPNDIVMVGGNDWPHMSHGALAYHFPADLDLPITETHSILDAIEQLRCHFLRHAGDPSPPEAWYLLNTHYFRLDPAIAEAYFHANGIEFSAHHFPAEEYLRLFRVSRWHSAPMQTGIMHPRALEEAYDMAGTWQRLGFGDAGPEFRYLLMRAIERSATLGDDGQTYQRYFSAFLDMNAMDAAQQCIEQFEEWSGEPLIHLRWYRHLVDGDLDAALDLLLSLPREAFGDPRLRGILEVTLWAAGEREAARASYAHHRPSLTEQAMPMLPILDALLLGDEEAFPEAALAYRSALKPYGDRGQKMVYLIAGLEHWISACMPPWQPAPVSDETLEEARQLLTELAP